MKKNSLNLNALKIESFVTSVEGNELDTKKVNGGFMHTCPLPGTEFITVPCNCGTSVGGNCNHPR